MQLSIERQARKVRVFREATARLKAIPRLERRRMLRRYKLRQRVARECKVHPSLVSKVLSGDAKSERVLLALDRAFAAVIRAESGEVTS